MKILQILKDCVTAAVKTDKLLFSKTDEEGYMLMSPDSLVLYRLPRVNVPFTFDGKCSTVPKKIWESCERESGYEEVTKRYIVESEKKPRRNLLILNDRVAVDMKLLKNFEPRPQLMIGEKQFSPVRVYENEQMVGLVMPVNNWKGESK